MRKSIRSYSIELKIYKLRSCTHSHWQTPKRNTLTWNQCMFDLMERLRFKKNALSMCTGILLNVHTAKTLHRQNHIIQIERCNLKANSDLQLNESDNSKTVMKKAHHCTWSSFSLLSATLLVCKSELVCVIPSFASFSLLFSVINKSPFSRLRTKIMFIFTKLFGSFSSLRSQKNTHKFISSRFNAADLCLPNCWIFYI